MLESQATPLLWALAFTAMNAALDPLFIFKLRMGAAGAAAGTSLAQCLALVPLLLALQRKQRASLAASGSSSSGSGGVRDLPLIGLFVPPNGFPALVASVTAYVRAGSYVLLRSVAKISAYSVCAREAARLGAVASAAHTKCFQLGAWARAAQRIFFLSERVQLPTACCLGYVCNRARRSRDDPAVRVHRHRHSNAPRARSVDRATIRRR